jgi:hypothetical protein
MRRSRELRRGVRRRSSAFLAVAALALAPTAAPARAQAAEANALAYLAIPLDGRSGGGPRYGLRFDLADRHGPGPHGPDRPTTGDERPPLLELRPGFGTGAARVHLAGVDLAAAQVGLGLDGGGSAWLWIGGGCAAVAMLAVVVAVGDVCLGINAGCRRDKDGDGHRDWGKDRREPAAVAPE